MYSDFLTVIWLHKLLTTDILFCFILNRDDDDVDVLFVFVLNNNGASSIYLSHAFDSNFLL